MRKVLVNLFFVCLSLAFTFVLLEVSSRIFIPQGQTVRTEIKRITPSDKPLKEVLSKNGSIESVQDWSGPHGLRLNPNTLATIEGHPVSGKTVMLRVNSLGLRGQEISAKKELGQRILLMGDSIIFGDYLMEEETIPSLVASQLNKSGSSTAEVINGGLPGANTNDEFHHYMELRDLVDPDTVIVGMYLNDAQASGAFNVKSLRFPFSKSRFLLWLVERLKLLDIEAMMGTVKVEGLDPNWRENFRAGRDLHAGDMFGSREGFAFEIYNAHEDFGLAWNSQSWSNLTSIIKTFKAATEERKHNFALFLLPVHIQVFSPDEVVDTYPQERFIDMCTDLNVKCLDLLPVLRAEAKRLKFKEMFFDHCHYRLEGNQLIAQKLAEWIKNFKG